MPTHLRIRSDDRSLSTLIFVFIVAVIWSGSSSTTTIAACLPLPIPFPSTIKIDPLPYQNFADQFHLDCVWTANITNEDQLIQLMNWVWANASEYTIRPRGMAHTWSPLTITVEDRTENSSKIILVDLRSYIKDMTILPPTPQFPLNHQVNVGTGTIMDDLMDFLAARGYTINCIPSTGQLTVGGVLCINGHGDGVRTKTETMVPGRCYGSLSNLVTELRAVVWNNVSMLYEMQKFSRNDSSCPHMLVHLGRLLITEVTLVVESNFYLQCESRFDVLASELFAHPTYPPNPLQILPTLRSFLDKNGRVKIDCFPYTDFCYLKVWTISPVKPLTSCAVTKPYNYNFPPDPFTAPARQAMEANRTLTPGYTLASFLAIIYGHLRTTCSVDIWGLASDTLRILQIPPPATGGTPIHSFVILTALKNVQAIVHEVHTKFNSMLLEYGKQGLWPINGPLQVRVTMLDDTKFLSTGIQPPSISSIRPMPTCPHFDVGIWISCSALWDTPGYFSFVSQWENYWWTRFPATSDFGVMRPEWSKGFGGNGTSQWANVTVIKYKVPGTFQGWRETMKFYVQIDPKKIIINPFLEILMS